MNKFILVRNKIKDFTFFIGGKLKIFFAALWKLMKNHKIWSAVICIVLALVLFIGISTVRLGKKLEDSNLLIKVEKRDIEEKINDSTVVEPNNEYSITANVTGEILDDPFEEGDTVQKGDLMYTIDASTIENSIQSADIAIAKAKKNYDDAINENSKTVRDTATSASSVESARIAVDKAQQAYNDALKARDDLSLKSNHTGIVTEIHISEGDTIAAGTKIADIIDNSKLKIKVPFNTADADNVHVGEAADLTLTKNGSSVRGVVTEIGALVESGSGFTSYKKVTIEVDNPGAISSGDTATAMVGDIACNDAGTFENLTEDSITASSGGKISSLYISENSHVYNGEKIAMLDSDSVESQISSALLSLNDANQALERAKIQQNTSNATTSLGDDKLNSAVKTAKMTYDDAVLSKEKLLKQLEDYTIKAPISGTVVTKNKKKGDNLGSGSSSTSSYSSSGSSSSSSQLTSASASSSAMAVIYDMSELKCTLNVDELDVKNVKTGQKVTITTDVTDKEYTGVVENISVNGTAGSNGVTTSPVKVNIIDFDDALLPGMNVEANIIISSVHNVLAIPVSNLNRGNTVYVKGDKTEENDKAPEGYKTVSVTTGSSDGEYIQVFSGVEEGEILYSTAGTGNSMEEMMQQSHERMKDSAGGGSGGGPGGGGM